MLVGWTKEKHSGEVNAAKQCNVYVAICNIIIQHFQNSSVWHRSMIIASKTAAQNTFPIFLDNSIIKSVMSNTLPGKIMKINRITFGTSDTNSAICCNGGDIMRCLDITQ